MTHAHRRYAGFLDEESYHKRQLSFFFDAVSLSMKLERIPMPPSANNIYSTFSQNGSIRRVKSHGFAKWEKTFAEWSLKHFAQVSHMKARLREKKPNQVISVHTEFKFNRKNILTLKNTPKRNDTSNRIKVIHDAVATVVGIDDCYFWDGTFSKRLTENEFEPETCSVELKLIDMPA